MQHGAEQALAQRVELVRQVRAWGEQATGTAALDRDAMDRAGCLSGAAVDALRTSGVLRAAVPADYGGPQLDPLTQIALVEEFSRIDGAVGWCAMIASAASYVAGFLEPEAGRRWFEPPDACLAGQLNPTGRAERAAGGYRVTGRFRFGSGIGHATMVLAGCLVTEGGELARTVTGHPILRTCLFRPDQCDVQHNWDTTGLRATGSHDYVIDDVFVPDADSYDPTAPQRRAEPLYAFSPLFLAPHDGVPLGIARRAIDTVIELAATKPVTAPTGLGTPPPLCDTVPAQEAVALAEAQLGGARALCYETVGDLWAALQAGERITKRQRGMYRLAMSWSHQVARGVVNAMYDVASTSAIERGSALDRTVRDITTACQHRMVHTRVYAPAGRLLMGLDSGDPVV